MSFTFLYQLMKKYKIGNRKILKKKEKVAVNLEIFTWNACFVQKASKNFFSRGFLIWVGRVTGNDNIFLVGLIGLVLIKVYQLR